jgi:leucyl-tRNA synthetase
MKPTNWPSYNPQVIEPRWQQSWEQAGFYLTSDGGLRPKYYCLDFFPYPSGDGLHVGHCRNYIPTDVLSRYKRMRGFNVLHPMGWDAFGEPAEQYAVRQGVHPRLTTDRNTANYRRQMTLMGASYDWRREIDSSQPEFYRWTQYFFLLLYRSGLAYRDINRQWWCDECQTTLSSHEVINGVCWRGHTSVYKREIPAWYFRITAYADELISGLETVDWPEPVKAMQRNWIGRSEGCEVIFRTEAGQPLPVFTTRPDTLFGVTFFVLAPEHPLVAGLTSAGQQPEVQAYIDQTARKSEVERQVEQGEVSGVFTGGYVVHPLSGERLPVWIADYVLPTYGTGAVMGVPAHDERDFRFARRFGLPLRAVVAPPGGGSLQAADWEAAYTGPGSLVHSGVYDGLSSEDGARRICADLQERGLGVAKVNYRMRDWLISRQRYWGTPIPIVYCDICGEQPVPEEQLPVLLPPMQDFQPDGSGRSALARLPEFVNTTCPACGGAARRETDTMGGFACSSWYFLRFTSPHYHEGPFDPDAMRYWMPVDLYVGGAEHAVLHLLYARFWTKALADAGVLPFREPFAKLLNQGQLLAPDGNRMSKTRGNVITPDSIVRSHGADAVRVYEMFMAPFDQDIAWSTEGLSGARRFLNKVWSLYGETYLPGKSAQGDDLELRRLLHRTIRRVEERIEGFRLNTMVSTLMEFANFLYDRQRQGRWQSAAFHQALEVLLVLLAPAAPHIAEELWQLTGHAGSVHQQPWPAWDPELARQESLHIPVQINGKLRELIEVPAEATPEEVQQAALAQPRLQQHLAGHAVQKIIYVPGKVLNLVVEAQPNAGVETQR